MILQRLAAALLAALLIPTAGAAEPFYRWTDADGRVYFSDREPAPRAAREVEQLARPTYAEPNIPAGHYAVTEQLQRMQAEREARERARHERQREARELALREREIAAAERAAEQAAAPSGGAAVWGVPRRYPHTRPWAGHHPGSRPGPTTYRGLWQRDHPAYRPAPPARPAARRPSSRGAID